MFNMLMSLSTLRGLSLSQLGAVTNPSIPFICCVQWTYIHWGEYFRLVVPQTVTSFFFFFWSRLVGRNVLKQLVKLKCYGRAVT